MKTRDSEKYHYLVCPSYEGMLSLTLLNKVEIYQINMNVNKK